MYRASPFYTQETHIHNLKETFDDKFEENFEEKFEEPYFKENLELNQRFLINSEKDDNDHNDDNRPPPETPPMNPQTEKNVMNKNIVECRNQLRVRMK